MDNWQEEISLLEAKDHIAFLQDSLSTLSSMSAELTEQIDRLKGQLATAQDQRDAAVYAKMQVEDAAEAQRAEMAAGAAWEAKVPNLTRLGQTLARLPGYKAVAADAAIRAARLPVVSATFQDLATVNGIGVAYEQRLYNAGIGTYWELAHLSDDDFVRMLHLSDQQQKGIDLDAIRSEARRLAVETDAVGALWEGETPDDFEPIKGIGKVFEQRLYDAGIRSYRTLAATTVENLAAICQAQSPVAPDFAAWIEQARTFSAKR